MRRIYSISFFVALLLLSAPNAFGQFGNEFQLANRLFQQQNYESALPIFKELHEENPNEYFFFDRYIACQIQLKEYDSALKTIENLNSNSPLIPQAKTLEGKLYYLLGDTSKAFNVWDVNLANNPRNLNVYMATASVMTELRAFDRAVSIYKEARRTFNNEQLFFNEVANTLLQSGKYEDAVAEWISWLVVQPDQMINIQRTLLRYNDPLLNDITILELDDQLSKLSVTNPAYNPLFRFQLWLLQENKLYRKAVQTARNFEESTSSFNYSLFQLGRNLKRSKEYELAVDAFQYYIDNSTGNIEWQSREELAQVYTHWAKQIDDYNLDFSSDRDSLFTKASEQLDYILSETANYRRIQNVLLMKAEIVLDYQFNLRQAENVLRRMEELNEESPTPEQFYIEGRIHLANKEFPQARIALTKSNKQTELGELAEKTRYFLALTDFYANDFEFASIQLKTLGRQSASYYANDALELRLWIMEGMQADSTGGLLEPFADALYASSINQREATISTLMSIIEDQQNPLIDDALILLIKYNEVDQAELVHAINNYLLSTTSAPLRERLYWERAKAIDKLVSSNTNSEFNLDDSIKNYEDLILTYPQGFYAPYARKRLQELSNRSI